MRTLVDLIRVEGDENEKREEALICRAGFKYVFETGKKEEIKIERSLPRMSITFQINKKLYLCGGFDKVEKVEQCVADFFTIDYDGKSADLAPMKNKRCHVSLSGLPSQMLSLGGWNQENLKVCEKYLMERNKWIELPPLNTAR